MPNLLPYASWEFLGNDESLKRLDKFELGDSDLYELVREIGECYEAEHIRETIVAFYRSKEAFEPWWGAVREKHDRDNRQEV
jgi:ATP-dependent RNA circularization protein (DNA/RNA ligase family)